MSRRGVSRLALAAPLLREGFLMWTKQEAYFAVPFGIFVLALVILGVLV